MAAHLLADGTQSSTNPFARFERDTLLRVRRVAQILGININTARRRIAAGVFPPPLRVGPRQTSWPAGVLADWFDGLTPRGAE